MVHDVALTPLAAKTILLLGRVADGSVQEQVVDLCSAELGQDLRTERLDLLQVAQVQRQDGYRVVGTDIVDSVVRLLCAGDISRAEDNPVRLRLSEELADGFEALGLG